MISYQSAKFRRFGDVFRWFLHFICRMSAIFLRPFCLTYWPRMYITRVDPHVDNTHKVWSWYDHLLPSYSVFVCRNGTWPCELDLWHFDLEQLSCMAGHLANLATKYEDPTPIRSWVMRYNVSRWLPLIMRKFPVCDLVTMTFDRLTLNSSRTWRYTWPTLPPCVKTLRLFVHELRVITFLIDYHWKCVRGHCACAESRGPWVGGQKQLHFWNHRPRFAYLLYNFYWATTTIKGRLLSSVSIAKALDCVNFLCVTWWPWPLTVWPWTVLVHGGSRGQPCHQVWWRYNYSFMSYEL